MGEDFADLYRRFRDVSDDEAKYPLRLLDARLGGDLSWADLKKKQRVVILAEAGSGKTSEFKAQWRSMAKAGDIACYTTVQELGSTGFEGALGYEDLGRCQAWKASSESIGWFFLDSVDEAKDDGVRFETAVRNLANAIAGREERARIFISGRFTDWDFIADRKSMDEWLAIPHPLPAPEPSYRDQIRATLQHRKPETADEPEAGVSVVLMTALDESRVRRYARNAGVTDIDRFMDAVDAGNLWRFASRPLDLEWMIDYWHDRGRLGTLAAMLEASIDARLVEPKPMRKRRDTLGVQSANHALKRIGAGLLLCGKDAVRVPSESVRATAADSALPLEKLLPDWQSDMIARLLRRPVFDPATLGRVRLHNDNEATLRSYLTARWLHDRRQKGCPPQRVDDLLFADLYGYQFARPDMLSTAAWLSIWNPEIADKLIAREPLALMTQGDPGALPIPTRVKAIEAALRDADQIDRRDFWQTHDALRRLADPALDILIPEWWRKFAGNREARHLLLRLIWLGKQKGGLEIAREAAFDSTIDDVSQLLAGRSLLAIGTPSDASAYAVHITAEPAKLCRSTVLSALGDLFPKFVSVEQLFAVVDVIGMTDEGGIPTIWPLGHELGERLDGEADLLEFLNAVLKRMGPIDEDREDPPFVSAFAAAAVTAATKLLELHPLGVPDPVVDLVLRLYSNSGYRDTDKTDRELQRTISNSPARRQQSFWRAAHVLRDHPYIRDRELSFFQMPMLGWVGQLTREDLPWLLEDATNKPEERDRRLAFQAAYFAIWRDGGKDPSVLSALASIAERDPALASLFAGWQSPEPETPEQQARMERLRKAQEENQAARDKRDESWIKFIEELRANPGLLDRPQPQTETTADSRLVHLWQFLSSRLQHRSRYAIDDLSMVEPIFGPEVTKKFGAALIAFAYARRPLLPSERPTEDRNKIYSFDSMGLAGMSLAAATRSNWATTLSTDDANRAARYAIVELNGFPDYFGRLAEAHPAIVREILATEIRAQVAEREPAEYGILGRLAYADAKFAELVAPDLELALADASTLPQPVFSRVVDDVIRGLAGSTARLWELVHSQITATGDPTTAAYLLSILFAIDGDAAADALRVKTAEFDAAGNTVLCSALMPRLFGGRIQGESGIPLRMSFANLEELVLIAFEGVRPVEDVRRSSGEVYSPDWRDNAQEARDAAFERLRDTPGEATHAALMRLAQRDGFPIPSDWLRKLARRRANDDAVLAAWRPEDVVLFENEFDRPPLTTADLQLIARRRTEQIQHDLHHDRFALGDVVQALPDENAVQRWFADRYEILQGNAYTVVRESHVAGEKEPDITLTSRANGVTLPIEVKVIDEMTVSEMEAALETQLCGQYLRHRAARHGVLLLVHQKPKAKGWILAGHAGHAPLATVLERLENKAREIRARSPDGPQPIVVCADVSTVPPRKQASPKQKKAPKRSKRRETT
ncbi:MAG: hypothetical protein EOR54_14620 [Mesorhizobium sp.]|nr:MAG: hypothetical protein EOR54_14620 [Mesorhizobium sp.]